MAGQGQSTFGAEGDTGAFSCIRNDASQLLDPPAQPWVTSVGGTSLETFDPGANPHPAHRRVFPRPSGRQSPPIATASSIIEAAISTRCSTSYDLAPHLYFHDNDGNHATNSNGEFPTVGGFDLATGIGTPITATFIALTL
jgi:subtilase family serine protease